MTASEASSGPSAARPGTPDPFAWARRSVRRNRERLVYATNVSLIAVLALAGSFLLDLGRSYWALLTVALVSQATSGLTVWRSVARLIGTLIGAGFALAAIALFAQNSFAMIGALALWIFAMGTLARFEIGLDAYAYSVSGLTALVIAFDTGPNAAEAYDIALLRTTETLLGIGAAFTIILVVFPVSASRTLLAGMAGARDKVFDLAKRAAAVGAELDVAETQEVTKALAATYGNLRAQKLERSHREVSTRKAAEATNRLNRLLIAAERMSYAQASLADADPSPQVAETSARLDELLNAVPRFGAPAGDLAGHAGAFRQAVAAMDLDPAIRELVRRPDRPIGREVTALDAMRRFALAAASYLDAEAAISDPTKPPPRAERLAPRYPDWEAALQRGARPAIVFVVLASVWLASASSSFQTLALISTGLCVSLPAIAPRAALTQGGKALGSGFAAMFFPVLALEAALPYVETFPAFAVLIGCVFFVFFFICFDQMKRTYALGGAIFLATALQPSNAEQYDALGVFNAAISLAPLPLAIVAAFTVIVPENQRWLRRHLAKAGTKLLGRAAGGRDDAPDEFLAQALDAVGDYGGDLDLNDPANRARVRRSRSIAAAGLQLYEINRMRRLGHLPEPLGARLAEVDEAVRREAVSKGEDMAVGDCFEAARRDAYRIAADETAAELAKATALRFAVGVEFLEVLAKDGRLRLEAT